MVLGEICDGCCCLGRVELAVVAVVAASAAVMPRPGWSEDPKLARASPWRSSLSHALPLFVCSGSDVNGADVTNAVKRGSTPLDVGLSPAKKLLTVMLTADGPALHRA